MITERKAKTYDVNIGGTQKEPPNASTLHVSGNKRSNLNDKKETTKSLISSTLSQRQMKLANAVFITLT